MNPCMNAFKSTFYLPLYSKLKFNAISKQIVKGWEKKEPTKSNLIKNANKKGRKKYFLIKFSTLN